MSTYAIGDIQGCYDALQELLETIRFDPARDRLWLVGDLVNRGDQSLAVLRWAMGLGDAAVTVLGNHDLHLLAVAEGTQEAHRGDTIHGILNAPDRDELLAWLRRRPLMHMQDNAVLVHAGLLPEWTAPQALSLAHEVEDALRGARYHEFLLQMYGNQPTHWKNDLTGISRLRVITNAMTRLRFCSVGGVMEFTQKGDPNNPPSGFMPWFDVPQRASREATIIFGHWSALGLQVRANLVALDSGCLWGGHLSAMRLEDRQIFQVPCGSSPGIQPRG